MFCPRSSHRLFSVSVKKIFIFCMLLFIHVESRSLRTKRFAPADVTIHRNRRHLQKVLKSLKIIYHQMESQDHITYSPSSIETDGVVVKDDQIKVIIEKHLGEDFPVDINSDLPPSHALTDLIYMSVKPDYQGQILTNNENDNLEHLNHHPDTRRRHNGPSSSAETALNGDRGLELNIYGKVSRKVRKQFQDIYDLCRSINLAKSKKNIKLQCQIVPSVKSETTN